MLLSRRPRLVGLVERAFGKADSECLYRIAPPKFRRRRENSRAINTAAEEKTEGDVAHQTAFNCLDQ